MVASQRRRKTPGLDARGRRQRCPRLKPLPLQAQRGNPPSLTSTLEPTPTCRQITKLPPQTVPTCLRISQKNNRRNGYFQGTRNTNAVGYVL
eukprot:6892759-Pyramimonas_sp.AAC.1